MNENIKTILKSIFGVFLVFALFIVIVISMDSDKEPTKVDIKDFITDTNFPVDDYIVKSKPKEEETIKPKQSIAILQKAKKEEESRIKKLKRIVFKSKEEIEEQEREEFINIRKNQIINEIYKDNSINKPLKNRYINSNKKQREDYGSNKFSNEKERDLATSETKLYRTITADKMIPATLINSIHSTLSGQVVAQIDDNIYSSMGANILIRKGSWAIGYYTNNAPYGSNRFSLIWTRIITTNGNNIKLTSSQTADILGNSGIVGTIDKKVWDRFGLPLTLSTISNGLLLAIAKMKKDGLSDDEETILDNSKSDLSYVQKTIVDEQVKIKPLITVKQGSKIFINPTVDIWFPKPKKNEILAQYFK